MANQPTSSQQSVPPVPPIFKAYVSGKFHGTILQCFLTGIYTGLFVFMMARGMIRRQENKKRIALFVIIAIQYGLIVARLPSICLDTVQTFTTDSFETVLNRLFYPSTATMVWRDVLVTTAVVLCDGLIIWRCWQIWNRSSLILFFFALLEIAQTAIHSYVLHILVILAPKTQDDPGVPALAELARVLTITVSFLRASLTIMASSLIILRIYSIGRMQGIRKFKLVIEIVVESAPMYSIPLLIAGVLDVVALKTLPGILDGMLSTLPGLAPLLMALRIHLGFARPDSSWAVPIPAMWIRSHGPAVPSTAEDKSAESATIQSDLQHSPGAISGVDERETEIEVRNREDNNGT